MPHIDLRLDGDKCWPDLLGRLGTDSVIEVEEGIGIAGLSGGMESGAPSVTIRLDLPDGTVILAQTSLALFLTAGDALKARYGDPRNA